MDLDLRAVLWVGGCVCAGKTTVAHLLGARLGVPVYGTDASFDEHARQADRQTQPTLWAYQHDDPLFLAACARPGAERARLWRRLYRELFAAVAADLAALGPVIAEGVHLLPECVAACASPRRAVWLVPTRAFYERHQFQRPSARERGERSSEEGWAYRAEMIGTTRAVAARLGLDLIEVDGSRSPEQIADDLAASWSRPDTP